MKKSRIVFKNILNSLFIVYKNIIDSLFIIFKNIINSLFILIFFKHTKKIKEIMIFQKNHVNSVTKFHRTLWGDHCTLVSQSFKTSYCS